MTDKKQITAAMLIIGNEVLSGRTQDKNLAFVGNALGEIGIDMKEVRIVPDEQDEIVDAVNALRAKYTYVFTSGGIGPTHDDITADCIAAAFGVSLDMHPLATQLLEAHYEAQGIEFNAARARMARIPDGASLIDNPVSTAPGFRIGNVHVMAGVPKIMQAMMENILPTLKAAKNCLPSPLPRKCRKARLPKRWKSCKANIRTSVSACIRFTALMARALASWRAAAMWQHWTRLRRR